MKRRRRVHLINSIETKLFWKTSLTTECFYFKKQEGRSRALAQLFPSQICNVWDQSALIIKPIDPVVARINIANSASLFAAHKLERIWMRSQAFKTAISCRAPRETRVRFAAVCHHSERRLWCMKSASKLDLEIDTASWESIVYLLHYQNRRKRDSQNRWLAGICP